MLTVALFPQVGLKFAENRHNPGGAPGQSPQVEAAQPVAKTEKPAASGVYVEVEGGAFVVKVSDGDNISPLTAAATFRPRSRSRPGERRYPGDRRWQAPSGKSSPRAEGGGRGSDVRSKP